MYLEVEHSGSQLVEKNGETFVWSGWGSMRQPYMESVTVLSDDEQIIRKWRFYRSVFYNFLRADDHLDVMLTLKSASPCRCISK